MHFILAQEQSGGTIGSILIFAVFVAILAGCWKMFEKGGQPGWGCLIPFYNVYLILKLAGRPGWWLVLFLIPFVNFLIAAVVWIDVARAFGKSVLFGIGLWLLTPIFVCVLGFGDAQYQGTEMKTGFPALQDP
jgi:hypothetical protein